MLCFVGGLEKSGNRIVIALLVPVPGAVKNCLCPENPFLAGSEHEHQQNNCCGRMFMQAGCNTIRIKLADDEAQHKEEYSKSQEQLVALNRLELVSDKEFIVVSIAVTGSRFSGRMFLN